MCFPELYPDGSNGLGATRATKLGRAMYTTARLMNVDDRWRRNYEWIFHMRSQKDKASGRYI